MVSAQHYLCLFSQLSYVGKHRSINASSFHWRWFLQLQKVNIIIYDGHLLNFMPANFCVKIGKFSLKIRMVRLAPTLLSDAMMLFKSCPPSRLQLRQQTHKSALTQGYLTVRRLATVQSDHVKGFVHMRLSLISMIWDVYFYCSPTGVLKE